MKPGITIERSERAAKNGWHHGWYTCTCEKCKKQYLGSKRSFECSSCAYMEEEEEIKTATAVLCIEIWVHCPHCNNYINLRDPDDTNGHDHDDCGDLLQQSCPSVGHWSEEHEKFEVDEVTCSQCKKEFDVRGMDW